jgi:xylitol oxidase
LLHFAAEISMTGESDRANTKRNWAGNYVFKAARIHRPVSLDDVRRLVSRSRNIRAIGTRHSFNSIADSAGDLIDLSALDPRFVLDREKQTITVGAATTYAELARHLQARGWALHNMASLPHISVAGATATGTHGSGFKSGSLATAVTGLQLVTATGDLRRVRRGDAEFDGMVVGLGAFGIVTRLTLDIEPTYDIRQDAFADVDWSAAISNFDLIMSAAYSVSLMTRWSDTSVTRLWLKTRLDGEDSQDVIAAQLGVTRAPCATALGADDAADGLNPFGVPGPWSERLPHLRVDAQVGPVEQIQSEYLVPRAQTLSALTQLREIGDHIDRHLHLTEIRTVAGDNLWLSPSYGGDCIAIHFTWKKASHSVDAITRDIEEMLLPLGGRPHWGKLMHARAERLAPVYPCLPTFRNLAGIYDPTGKFRNEFLDAHVFG